MGSRCYYCGEGFGRCYDHAGLECPEGCDFGKHDCPGDPWGDCGTDDLVVETVGSAVTEPDKEW